MTIHVVVGPPCSGKTTFVDTNAPQGIPRWDFDRVATTVAGEDTNYEIPKAVMDIVLAMRRGVMGYVLDVETEVEEMWMIHSSPSPNTIQRLTAVGAEFHLLDPGLEECIARAQRENRPPHTEEAIRAWYASPPELPGEKGGEPMKTKRRTVDIKATEDEGKGIITAYASVFDTVDSYGDVVRKGAFTQSLADWKAKGRTIPLLYGHNMSDPFSNIGAVTEAVEDDHGLKVTAQFDLDNPTAKQVFKLVREKRLNELSFAFSVIKGGWAEQDSREIYELLELKLHEVSIVPIGANPDTEVLTIKSGEKTYTRSQIEALLETLSSDQIKAALGPPRDVDGGQDPDPDPNTNQTPDGTPPPGVSPSKGQATALEARLMLLERTPHV